MKILGTSRMFRFVVMALVTLVIHSVVGVLLMWLIYPEWDRRTKIIVTIIVGALLAYRMYSSY